ncbi:hypothetical protein CMUS01_15116 [Colletotrichum musicola]|uniref:Uncharacterized protein n=1 Tax=Colletotrichum musicola TaxID=2175873 RepID=A0A8H6MPH0_9PEZI|nr:hypothetical protein CMUS01_15116 [Colletotrichum musicola]
MLTALPALLSVVADVHKYAFCTSRIQPINNNNNEAATRKACAAYKKRNTGNKQWDKCPDCTVDPTYCAIACNSAGSHIGGDEWLYYCEQNGADGADAY